ncbi:MAG: glycoside hydrolase family 10 protein [Scytolyngbya sp. HA4215-MV1]|jgi:uncharacterized lipoprotein YddW (UPF0748 family)|nr:glycoside hydrolase family 10 protein [Scytolyngbya sp. HA4215-MV1]
MKLLRLSLIRLLQKWSSFLVSGLAIAICLWLTLIPKPIAANSPASEIRGVWITNIDSNVLFKANQLTNAVQELARLNFNTLYPVVWNWGYTTYPSTVMQSVMGNAVDPRPDSLTGRDMLAELVQQAHQNKLAVLPWFEFGFMTPEDSALAIRHPDWLTQKQASNSTTQPDHCPCDDGSAQTWMEGRWSRVWLNPFKPEVQQFIQDLVLEIVTKYDVDGIQFDDHFGLPYEFGYDDFTVQLYRQETGKTPPTNPQDPTWIRWRANKITAFTQRLFRAVKTQKPNVIFALSPNNYEFSLNHSLQDWWAWERAGYIEELVLQVYRDSPQSFLAELNRPEVLAARRHIPVGVGVLTGLRQRAVSSQQVQEQVQLVRRQQMGVSFFFYETLWNLTQEPIAVRKAAFQKLFPTPVARPKVG